MTCAVLVDGILVVGCQLRYIFTFNFNEISSNSPILAPSANSKTQESVSCLASIPSNYQYVFAGYFADRIDLIQIFPKLNVM